MAIGLVIYFAYGYGSSVIRQVPRGQAVAVRARSLLVALCMVVGGYLGMRLGLMTVGVVAGATLGFLIAFFVWKAPRSAGEAV
jgi:hypothetical protein